MTLALTDQVAKIGTVVSQILGELRDHNTDFNGQPLIIYGPADDAATLSAPPAIFWAPLREAFAPGQRTGATGAPGPLFNRGVPISFLLFGGLAPDGTHDDTEAPFHDCDLTEILQSKLVNAIHRNISQQSYALESANWFNSGRTGIGMSLELVVEFKLPLIREDNPTVKATAVNFKAEISKP